MFKNYVPLACRERSFARLVLLAGFSALIAVIIASSGCGMLSQSTSSPSMKATATPQITVTPANPIIASEATQQFSALVRNTSNTAVLWTTSAGTISSTGLFRAPRVTTAQSFSVIATSVADTSVSNKITATLTPVQNIALLRIVTSSLT